MAAAFCEQSARTMARSFAQQWLDVAPTASLSEQQVQRFFIGLITHSLQACDTFLAAFARAFATELQRQRNNDDGERDNVPVPLTKASAYSFTQSPNALPLHYLIMTSTSC